MPLKNPDQVTSASVTSTRADSGQQPHSPHGQPSSTVSPSSPNENSGSPRKCGLGQKTPSDESKPT
ncbi:hypothetical protein [Glycomyces endophyticus]